MNYESRIKKFANEYRSGQNIFSIASSGSTGSPKLISFTRKQLQKSAELTCAYFNLIQSDVFVTCLPIESIAGVMMVVRSLEVGSKNIIVEPRDISTSIKDLEQIDFIALAPLQIIKIIENGYLYKLKKSKAVLIGGGILNSEYSNKLTNEGINAFQTYGMTETLTHVAVKQVSDRHYHIMPEFGISMDDRDCAVIQTPYFSDSIITNDIIKLESDDSFLWLGRYDNIINSGGLKVIPEVLEDKIQIIFDKLNIENRFYISSRKDEQLGEQVIIVIEGVLNVKEVYLKKEMKNALPEYHAPKCICLVSKLLETKTGKIIRTRINK